MKHTDKAREYAAEVLAGRIPACKWVRLACRRFEADLARQETNDFPFAFKEESTSKANRVCRFMEKLPHIKGRWAVRDKKTGRFPTLKLEPWQCFILCNLYGWLKPDGTRRFQTASLYVPRKNGKSFFGAGLGWWMFAKDDEPGAEVYSGATSEKQAWEVFRPARQMAIRMPELAEELEVTVNAGGLVKLGDGSRFEPIIGTPGDGASPHFAIIDEYHEHNTSVLHDTMKTGMGGREQPIVFIISTAGENIAGPCKADWDSVCDILGGAVEDETHFGVIYTIDDGDDWTEEAALIKANPNWKVSVNPEIILPAQKKAARDARYQGTFKTKHLNMWVSTKSTYFNLEEWMACRMKAAVKLEEMAGQPCYLAGDFASKRDLNTLIHLFPMDNGRFRVYAKHYLPRGTVDAPENQHYRAWENSGRLTVCDGDVIDYGPMIEDAADACRKFEVREMPFDPNRAWGVFPQLQAVNVPVVEYRIVVLTMSEPMKFLDALIRAGRIEHDGDPILSWAISNVVAAEDKKENVFPNKPSAEKKIDPAVALIMALGRAMVAPASGAGAYGAFSF